LGNRSNKLKSIAGNSDLKNPSLGRKNLGNASLNQVKLKTFKKAFTYSKSKGTSLTKSRLDFEEDEEIELQAPVIGMTINQTIDPSI
jgi:hypothetical protein